MLLLLLIFAQDDYFHDPFAKGKVHQTTISTGTDSSIQVICKGRSGNIELKAGSEPSQGLARVNYQKGDGFVGYDHTKQIFTFESKRKFSFNRMSKKVMRTAPYLVAEMPNGAQISLDLDMTELGYGSFNFSGLHIKSLKCDVQYGDVDMSFPTLNEAVIRDEVAFHLMAGDLELHHLGNLKASDIKINGGVGEASIDFGPDIHQNTQIKFDHDIGRVDVSIPKGIHVVVKGTSRDLSSSGLVEQGNQWETKDHVKDLPVLTIELSGPLGSFDIRWK